MGDNEDRVVPDADQPAEPVEQQAPDQPLATDIFAPAQVEAEPEPEAVVIPPWKPEAAPEPAPEVVPEPVAEPELTAEAAIEAEAAAPEPGEGAQPAETVEPDDDASNADVPDDIAALEAELAAEPEGDAEPDASAEQDATAAAAGESLDDIPPATEAAAANAAAAAFAADVAEPASSGLGVPWWPFLAYLGLWVVLVAVAIWQFLQVPPGHPVYETTIYSYTVLGGLIMTAAGPLLIAAVWLASWLDRPKGARVGLLSSALIKGATATLGGVVLWWIALIIVDYMRLGRPL
jgi:hypothetical protein